MFLQVGMVLGQFQNSLIGAQKITAFLQFMYKKMAVLPSHSCQM